MGRIYLDWAATAPPFADIAEQAARIAVETFGNPSSAHDEGHQAARVLEQSRARFASALGVSAASVVFTSGGTESNNIVMSSVLSHKGGGEIAISGIEHSSVHESADALEALGYRVRRIPTEPDGQVDPAKLNGVLSDRTLLVAVMHVNNETGAVQPIAKIVRTIRDFERSQGPNRHIHFHTDGVQALGKIETAYAELGVDSASFSGHKLGGLRGAGALYLRRPIPVFYRGGGQEKKLRPGTENLPAIWAIAEAADRAAGELDRHYAHAMRLESLLTERIGSIRGARFLLKERADDSSSPYILSVAFPPLPGEVLVRTLNDRGCAVSTGSACASRHPKDRRVLMNMGVDEETARAAIRISTGYATTEDEVLRFVDILAKEVRTWSTPLRA